LKLGFPIRSVQDILEVAISGLKASL